MLGTTAGLRFCGEASSGREALEAVGTLKADLVLMDVHMPELDGPASTRLLLSQYPHLKVIAWTVSESSDDLLRMMQAGCSGYVLKDSGPSELQRALLAAVRSESPVPRRMIPEVLRRVATQTPLSQATTVALTSREMQIPARNCQGTYHKTARARARFSGALSRDSPPQHIQEVKFN